MANPYEVEHNIKDAPKSRSRRPDMSSFFSQLSQIETSSPTHLNEHAQPTPIDMAAAGNLLLAQYHALQQSGSSSATLEYMTEAMEEFLEAPPEKVEGVPQSYLDELERVPKKALKKTDTCPICTEKFLDDEFPLVVVLPCHSSHKFDLDCVGPWLRLNGTCPLDRKEMLKKKEVVKPVEDDEEEFDEMYA